MTDFSALQFRQLVVDALARDAESHRSATEKTPIKDLAWHEGEVTALRDAAVLIPIVDRGHDATIILTQRTGHLPSHAGQISFPGGKLDEGDASPEGAALREAHEEIGLSSHFVDTFGLLRPYISSTGYRIFPVLSTVRQGFSLEPNPCEVEEIFEVPLRFLMDPANHQRKSGQWRGKTRHYFAMPYKDHYIWGVTAGILRNLYETVYHS
nr:CoA pyrophosphatase [uncultured Cohaesibacter sp.]